MGESSVPAPGVFVGVDIAKGKHYACAVSARGEALFSRAVPNDEAGIRRLIDDASSHGGLHPGGEAVLRRAAVVVVGGDGDGRGSRAFAVSIRKHARQGHLMGAALTHDEYQT